MVVCQPGAMEVAKSKDTMVCTETSGVEDRPGQAETSSKRCQSRGSFQIS